MAHRESGRFELVMLYEELSHQILGAAIEVHRVLGSGFLETVYHQALAYELSLRQIPFERQVKLPVRYKGLSLGEYRADFVIQGKIVVEIKSLSALVPAHAAQALHYLACTGYRLALLLNFGARTVQIRRIIR